METVLSCIAIIGLAVLGAAVAYYRASAKLQAKAAELINQAEGMYTDVTKAGGQRFEWVVDQLYKLVPAIALPILTRERVEIIVQSTFDFIVDFAKKQLDKIVGQLPE